MFGFCDRLRAQSSDPHHHLHFGKTRSTKVENFWHDLNCSNGLCQQYFLVRETSFKKKLATKKCSVFPHEMLRIVHRALSKSFKILKEQRKKNLFTTRLKSASGLREACNLQRFFFPFAMITLTAKNLKWIVQKSRQLTKARWSIKGTTQQHRAKKDTRDIVCKNCLSRPSFLHWSAFPFKLYYVSSLPKKDTPIKAVILLK